jgi:formylglycine-generating enzyme required for sulfatase activity
MFVWRHFLVSVAALVSVGFSAVAQQIIQDCTDCPAVVVVPAGQFKMGTPAAEAIQEALSAGAAAREAPVHNVVFAQPFAMGLTEVTRDQFAVFVADTGWAGGDGCFSRTATGERANVSAANWAAPGIKQTGSHPVVCVSYSDVQAYIAWLSLRTKQNYRLPSEAEWEYAARAGTETPWFWGTDKHKACTYANVPDGGSLKNGSAFDCSDSFADTAPVASYRPNQFGLHDMLGNVWEWTQDCLQPNYEKAPVDGSAWVSGADCGIRVVRGGGWAASQTATRAAARSSDPVAYRGIGLGFRVVREFK